MSRFAIVAVGYNREESMKRLVCSLKRAQYSEPVDLIISIDNSGTDTVEKYAKTVQWKFGEKIVRTFEVRQGLKKHILACGDYLHAYDAIAVFEDDILVAPSFFNYMVKAYECYKDDMRIAGLSLYSHAWNVNAVQLFTPEKSAYDTYFLQFAQSWGQVWMKKQWFEFREWLDKNDGEVEYASDIPSFVSNWPKNSWLKFHIKYCIRANKYFVYPYDSLTTCFSDIGEHQTISNTMYQVPISAQPKNVWDFAPFEDDAVKYDAFFERQELGKVLGIDDDSLTVDLYGAKDLSSHGRYVLTMKALPYHVVSSFGLHCRPIEMNVEVGNAGSDIFLYDTSISGNAPAVDNLELKQFCYHQKMLFQNKRMVMLLKANLIAKLKTLIKR